MNMETKEQEYEGSLIMLLGFLRGIESKYPQEKESIQNMIVITRLEDIFLNAQAKEKDLRGRLTSFLKDT